MYLNVIKRVHVQFILESLYQNTLKFGTHWYRETKSIHLLKIVTHFKICYVIFGKYQNSFVNSNNQTIICIKNSYRDLSG